MSKANYVNMILYDRFGLPYAMVEVMLAINIKKLSYTPKCTSLEPCVKGAKRHWNPLSQSSIVPIVSIIS